jgi:hypothetical protein
VVFPYWLQFQEIHFRWKGSFLLGEKLGIDEEENIVVFQKTSEVFYSAFTFES